MTSSLSALESHYWKKDESKLSKESSAGKGSRGSCSVFLHCDGVNEASFGKGTKLTVLETNQPITPPTVTLLPPSQHECYNQKDKEKKKTLVCVASAFYPDHVSVFWSMNGHNVTTGVATDDRALRNGAHYSLTSRLRVNATTWFTPANRFTCTVSFFNGTDSSHHSDDVAGSPGGEETMTREKYLRITQSAKLSYVVLMVKSLIYGAFVVFLVWKLQGSTGKHN